MRLALVSDIHGNLAALEAVIADLENRQIDQVVNLGDTLSGPLLPAETAQRLQKKGRGCTLRVTTSIRGCSCRWTVNPRLTPSLAGN